MTTSAIRSTRYPTLSASVIFACMLLFVGCDQELHNPFSSSRVVLLAVKIYRPDETAVFKRGTIPTPEELDANEAEGKKLFSTAFATESICHGIEILKLVKPGASPEEVMTLGDSLVILYDSRSPGHWSYSLNYHGNNFGAVVDNEHEVAKQVCQVIKGTGGMVSPNWQGLH
jgi:hypothetical protein